MLARSLLAAAALAAAGCQVYNPPRGTLAFVSSRPLPGQAAAVYYPHVVGSACFNPPTLGADALELAVADAIAKRPGANALALVAIHLENPCFVVEGTPIRLK